ncbi:unnamed protein product, partial [Prorocentrum cordatum]
MPPRVVLCELCGGKFFPHSSHSSRSAGRRWASSCTRAPTARPGCPCWRWTATSSGAARRRLPALPPRGRAPLCSGAWTGR